MFVAVINLRLGEQRTTQRKHNALDVRKAWNTERFSFIQELNWSIKTARKIVLCLQWQYLDWFRGKI